MVETTGTYWTEESGMKNNTSGSKRSARKKNNHFGTTAIIGISLFLLIVVALHLLQPDLNPLTRFISEYIAGQFGWLLRIAFFGLGIAQIFVAIGLYRLQNALIHSIAGSFLLMIAGVAYIGSGIFDTDLQGATPTPNGMVHDLIGFIWFFAFLATTYFYSRKLRIANKEQGLFQVLRYFPWLIVIMFIAMIFVFGSLLNLPGLGQRLVMITILSWLFLMARALQTGDLDFS